MFCKELGLGEEEFGQRLEELREEKMAGAFELDMVRIGSMTKLRKVVSSEGSVRVYSLPGQAAGTLFAGTEFETEEGPVQALVQIDVSDLGQSYLSVHSASKEFREVIARNLLDLLVRIK